MTLSDEALEVAESEFADEPGQQARFTLALVREVRALRKRVAELGGAAEEKKYWDQMDETIRSQAGG